MMLDDGMTGCINRQTGNSAVFANFGYSHGSIEMIVVDSQPAIRY